MHTWFHKLPSITKSYLLSGCILLVIILAGCKKEDQTPPSFSLSSPAGDISAQANSTIQITGSATDNEMLKEVSASLIRATGTSEARETAQLSGNADDFNFSFQLGNLYTPTDDYLLQVTVSDASGNSESRFFDAFLTEVPRKLLGTFLGVQATDGSYSVQLLDTLGSILQVVQLGDSLSALAVDHRQAIVLTGQSLNGRLNGYRAADLSLLFSEPTGTALQRKSITDIHVSGSKYYVASEIQPYIRIYNSGGNLSSSFGDITLPAQHIAIEGDRMYVAVSSISGSNHKIDAYGASSGIFEHFFPSDFAAEALFALESGEVAYAGNEIGFATARVLGGSNLALLEERSVSGLIYGGAGENGQYFLHTDQGILPWQLPEGNLQAPIATGTYTGIGYDDANGHVYAGTSTGVEIYNSTGGLRQNLVGLTAGSVRKITHWYNK